MTLTQLQHQSDDIIKQARQSFIAMNDVEPTKSELIGFLAATIVKLMNEQEREMK